MSEEMPTEVFVRADEPSEAELSEVTPTETTIITRRGMSAERLLPKEAAADTTVVSRNVLRPRVAKAATSRERKIAGDLPDWEPLPPGELLVTRF